MTLHAKYHALHICIQIHHSYLSARSGVFLIMNKRNSGLKASNLQRQRGTDKFISVWDIFSPSGTYSSFCLNFQAALRL